jgi:hypothetical protein
MVSKEFQKAENIYKTARRREEQFQEWVTYDEMKQYEDAIVLEFSPINQFGNFIKHFFPTVKLRPWQEKHFVKNFNNPNLFGMVFSSGNNIGKTAIICISIIYALMCYPFCIITSVINDSRRKNSIKAEILKWVSKMDDPDLFHSMFVSNTGEIYKKDPDVKKQWESAKSYKVTWCWDAEVVKSGATIQGKRSDNSMFIVDEAAYIESEVLVALTVNRIGEIEEERKNITPKPKLQTMVICGNLMGAYGNYMIFLTNPIVKKYMYVKNLTEEAGDLRQEDAMPAKQFLIDVFGEDSPEYIERALSIKVPKFAIFDYRFLRSKRKELKGIPTIESLGQDTIEFLLSSQNTFCFTKKVYGDIFVGLDPAGFGGKDTWAFVVRNKEEILWITVGGIQDCYSTNKIYYALNKMFPQAVWCVEINGVGASVPNDLMNNGVNKDRIKKFYSTGKYDQAGGLSPAYKFKEDAYNFYNALILAARAWSEDAKFINSERLFNELTGVAFTNEFGKRQFDKDLYKKEYGKSSDLLDAFAHSFIVGRTVALQNSEEKEKNRMRNLGCLSLI